MTIDPAPVQTIRTASDETKLVEHLIGQIGRDRYTRFFDGSVRIESTPQAMVLQVGSEFESDLLQRRFAGDVERAVVEVRGEGAVVRWEVAEVRPARVVAPEHTNPIPLHATQRLSQSKPQPVRSRAARTRYSLDTLVVGRTNRMAVNAALELAAQKQVAGISALFVHGPCGVGKTHLLQGVAERFRRECPGARVRYVTGEAFANEFIAAVQSRSLEAFRKRYRGVDLLCIDDVHFVAGKKATESELLHTIDALDLDGARVMLVSDEHPKRIERLSHRLVSRCVSGMVVRIEPPDQELRSLLATRIAERRGLSLEPGAADAIASACHASAREVEGALLRVEAYQKLLGGPASSMPINAATVRRVLGDGVATPGRRPLRVNLILDVVCEKLGVQPTDVLGSGRHRLVVFARSMCALLARNLTTRSFPEIARDLNRKNHSTIVTAAQRTQKMIDAGESRDAGGILGELPVSELHAMLKDEILRRASEN
ncbi:MAG: DnaA ATPase domain-containing protein [Phycisphaerales bacterium JB065]